MSELTIESIGLTPDYFLRRLETAGQFADQNERYATLQSDPTFDALDVQDFRGLGNDALYQEQHDTRSALLELDHTPYTAIVEACDTKTAELQAAQSRLDTITDQEDERKSRLLAAARRLSELAPYAQEAASKLAQEKIHAVEDLDRQGLQERIGQVSLELSQLEESLRISSMAWPVPLVIRDYDLVMTEDLIIMEDEIPIDPETHAPGEALRKLIERHGTTHRASLLLASYFLEHPDIIFMPHQLGAYIYTDESHFEGMSHMQRQRCISQRIHRLLNQFELVKPMLEQAGYQLQYGYRHYINSQTSKPTQRKRRIYRAVEIATNPDAPQDFEETVYPDIQSEVPVPLVIRNAKDRHAGLAVEKLSTEDAERARHITEVMEQLWTLDLLPDEVDDTLTVRNLRAKILNMRRADRKLPIVRKLLTKAASAQQHIQTNATDIIMSAIDRRYAPRYSSDKDYRHIQTLISSMLENFYESLAD